MEKLNLPHNHIHCHKLFLSPLAPAMGPVAGLASAKSDGSPLDYDVVVILAAMVCALVCALGLNSMLQCVTRCTRRVVTEPVEWFKSRRANAGLKKEEVRALPTATYDTSGSPASTSGCAICLADFSNGEKMRVIPRCSHRFHVACIDTWLLSHSSCPSCRRRISSDAPDATLEIITSL